MSISASAVKELREKTGAPMMDCKKALQAVDGDIEKAVEHMRKQGMAKAGKKQGRATADGLMILRNAGNHAVVVEINCETDFVAKGDEFSAFANEVADIALEQKTATLDDLLAQKVTTGETVSEKTTALIAKIGENIQVRRLAFFTKESNEQLGAYLHMSRIGAMVLIKGGDADLAKGLAMHVAANQPLVVTPGDVAADIIAKEREVYEAQAKTSNKPPQIQEKMIQGRLNKFREEVSLTGQPYVRDPNVKVAEVLQKAKAEVIKFIRFGLGEGFEKKEENFLDEVMAQVKGSS